MSSPVNRDRTISVFFTLRSARYYSREYLLNADITMNLVRSPPGSGNGEKLGGSQPNLSEIHNISTPQVTYRNFKRKVTDDDALIRTELSEMRKQMSEMMLLLKTSTNDQAENYNKLCQDVTAIKNEVGNISKTIENLTSENSNIKDKLHDITTVQANTEKKSYALGSRNQ